MRILSQGNGKFDLPYESVILEKMEDSNTIYAYTGTGQPFNMANYSSVAKMDKAMDMLRKAYAGLPIIMRNVDITYDVAEMLKKWEKQGIVYRTADNEPSSIECVNNGYFQFPSDEEIEV